MKNSNYTHTYFSKCSKMLPTYFRKSSTNTYMQEDVFVVGISEFSTEASGGNSPPRPEFLPLDTAGVITVLGK